MQEICFLLGSLWVREVLPLGYLQNCAVLVDFHRLGLALFLLILRIIKKPKNRLLTIFSPDLTLNSKIWLFQLKIKHLFTCTMVSFQIVFSMGLIFRLFAFFAHGSLACTVSQLTDQFSKVLFNSFLWRS